MGCNASVSSLGLETCGRPVEVVSVGHAPYPQGLFHEDYTLKDKLGKGSFAQVHLAQAVARGDAVAVKITDMRAAKDNKKCDEADERAKSQVLSEVAVLRRVGTQPHCVAFHGAYFEGFLSYIIMERCDMTLLQALESGPELTERTLVRTVREMLQALETIHKLHIVHRDIKPDNFLLACSGKERAIKLCDFGLAAMLPEGGGGVPGVVGTAPYMSPEILVEGRCGTAADVWALGALVYVLLCGRFPYQPLSLTAKAVKAAIASGTRRPAFRPVDGLGGPPSPAALELLRALLDRAPGTRPSAANALQLSWVASPATSQRSGQSLWPMLDEAKSVGAFDDRDPRHFKQSDLDMMLASLQAIHRDAQRTGNCVVLPAWDSLQSKSTCANLRESADGGSLASSYLGSAATCVSSLASSYLGSTATCGTASWHSALAE